ncbi:MAG TPA: DNA methyltransferase [Chitinophagaceae bacterium]|nr:DNA methyltransferase [Chitinophagaceae bacterium]
MSIINDNHHFKDGGFSNYENAIQLPRHRWYYYKEGFSPLLVENAIQQVGLGKDEIVIDPFNGSGTTTLTATSLGYPSIGVEVNPFTTFLAQTKTKNADSSEIDKWAEKVLIKSEKGLKSDLLGYSTFSKVKGLDKWLFNDSVLKSFEGGWSETNNIESYNLRRLLRLALITATMDNCNARRDGKCLRYRDSWKQYDFDKYTFLDSLENNIAEIKADVEAQRLPSISNIYQGDCRKFLQAKDSFETFKLCITSPPYLNTFDYTDIYRPELFLGKFVNDNQELYNLRLQTVRSHLQAAWDRPNQSDFGDLYTQNINHLNANLDGLMHKNIPLMVQAYFEDMHQILSILKTKAQKDAQIWFVVSNSAYADREIPVDLIISDIGSKIGWYLKEIVALRYLKRRKTRHSPNITQLRESVIIFQANKSSK